MLNITTFLDANACRLPSKTVFLNPETGASFTSGDLLRCACGLAALLLERGVSRGDRVLLYLDSSPEYLLSYFALWRIGAVAVPCNRVYTADELAYLLRQSGAVLCVTDPDGAATLASIPGAPPSLVAPPADTLRSSPVIPPAPTSPDDLCQLQYTSGTTGKPKGAMLTHGNWLAALLSESDVLDCRQFDVYLGIYPMGHVGLSWGIAALRAGALYVMMRRYRLEPYLDLCERHGVTILAGMPPVIHTLLDCPPGTETRLRAVRSIISGGGPLHREIWRKFHLRYGIPVVNAYGLSETIVVGTGTVIRPEDYATADRFESVGHPVCFSEVKIVDVADPSRTLPPDAPGEIALRGPAVAAGYWQMPAETADVFLPDGWFLTGDIGYLDADNRLFITDRKKDMIVFSGWKIYPTELEETLLKHPAVAELAVFGLPDEHHGELPAVAVVWRPDRPDATPDALLDFARAHLAPYKVPRRVFEMSALPRVNGWKILRRDLRSRFSSP